jgi:branched-chain amino acid transport system substrate-binding protein
MMGLGMLRAGSALVALSVLLMALFAGAAQAREPIKIGFSVSLTGGLASAGKAHLLSKQIWVE